MNINASIVDQRITGIIEKHSKLLPSGDDIKKRSTAFVLLSMATFLDMSIEEAAELLTDGGNDAGVDGLHLGDVEDGEFLITIFQGKYKQTLDGNSNFPETEVKKIINTIQVIFNPNRSLSLNNNLEPQIEEARSLIRDGYIPSVRIVLCNNGAPWTEIAQQYIDALDFGDKVEFCHFNHDRIVQILQQLKKINVSLQLTGKIITEDMNFMRILIGRVAAQQISDLFEQYGDGLLQRNIRRYLGLNKNRVNWAIRETLHKNSENFYFYNNGITIICDQFDYNV